MMLRDAQRWDVVVAPAHGIRTYLDDDTLVLGSEVALGSVSVGVAVKDGAYEPDLSTVEAFRSALLASDKLVFNTATSGQRVEDVIDQLGLTEVLAKMIVRPKTGSAVMRCLASGYSRSALGFGQTTEIKLHEELGIRLLGPLPGRLGQKTLYQAGLLITSGNCGPAQGLLAFFASVVGKKILLQSGLELRHQS